MRQEHRRRGVAATLTAVAEREARAPGFDRIHVGVSNDNEPAHASYRRCGYVGCRHSAETGAGNNRDPHRADRMGRCTSQESHSTVRSRPESSPRASASVVSGTVSDSS
ncbi:MAG: GNAT family N-acetyltransferase [Acidimicrobiia bacterium]|nr:GNAT family N-acetyltransferase [Acidimicrobiia bacterium]